MNGWPRHWRPDHGSRLAGALMMGGGGSGQTVSTNTIQSATPWAGVQPYITDVLSQAQNLFRNGPNFGASGSTGSESSMPGAAPSQWTLGSNGQYTDQYGNTASGSQIANPNYNPALAKLGGGGNYDQQFLPGGSAPTQSFFGPNDLTTAPSTGPNGGFPGSTMPQFFPGSTVASFNPAEQQALQATEARATAGSPLLPAAQGQLLNTINGDYVKQGNPYLGGVMQNIADTIQPQVASQFESSGRYGSPSLASASSRAMTDALAPYAFQNYTNERQLQQNAVGAAPGMAQADYADPTALMAAGQTQQAQSQAQLADQINRWNFSQNEPMSWLQQYAGLVSGQPGGTQGTSTSQVPIQGGNSFLSALGGLSSAAGLAGNLGLFGGAAAASPYALSGVPIGLAIPDAALAGAAAAGGGAAAGGAGSALIAGLMAASDERLKEVSGKDENALGILEEIPVYSAHYRGENQDRPMVMAQDLEKVLPEVVHEIEGVKVVDFAQLVPVLIGAVKSLSAKLSALEAGAAR